MAGDTKLGSASIPIRATLDELDKDLEGVRGHVERALAGVQDLGKVALGGLALGAVAVAGAIATIGPAAIKAASDLNESVSKANVVFGDSVKVIDAFAASSAEAFGIAKQAAYESTSTFGNLFTTMGLGKDSAAGMSVDIVKLAADLASFNNLDTADVLQKLRSGLIGEAEPMRSLGVMLTADAVEAKALAMGLTKVAVDSGAVTKATSELAASQQRARDILKMYGNESKKYDSALKDTEKKQKALTGAQAGGVGPLTESAKLQARYALILEQTKTAQGDFARTSDGLANTQRILDATFKDISADIGTAFLPMVLGVAQAVTPIVKALMPRLTEVLKKLSPIITDVGNSIGIFVEVLMRTGNPLEAVRGALDNFPNLKPMFENLVTGVQSFLKSIQPVVDQVTAWLAQNVSLKDVLLALGIAIASVVIPAILGVVAAVAPIVLAFVALVAIVALVRQAWEENWGGIRDTLTAAWTGTILPALQELWTWLQVAVPAAIQTLSEFWTGTLQPALMQVWGFIQTSVIPMLGELWQWLQTNVPAAIQAVSGFITGTLIPALQAIWAFIQENIIPMFQQVASVVIPLVVGAFEAWWTGLTEHIIPILQAVWDFIQTSIIPLLSALAELVTSVLIAAWEAWWFGMQNRIMPVLSAIWAFIDKSLMPIFKMLADVLKNVLGVAFKWVQDNVFQPLIDALIFIKGLVDDIIETIRRMKSALAGVKLPGEGGGGGRAGGGPVAARTPYMVGERGPEWFVPDVSGMIVPETGRVTNSSPSYTLNIYTSAPAEDIVADFAMLQTMAA